MPFTQILDLIRNEPRKIVQSKAFRTPTNICLLDFLTAPTFFITEYGQVWNRYNFNPGLYGTDLPYGWKRTVLFDQFYHMPWVSIPITLRHEIFNTPVGYELLVPVPQLLGWAFAPENASTTGVRYAVHKNGKHNSWPTHGSEVAWTGEMSKDNLKLQPFLGGEVLEQKSPYLEFIKKIHGAS